MAAFVPGHREKKKESPFHYSVEPQWWEEQDSINNMWRSVERKRDTGGDWKARGMDL